MVEPTVTRVCSRNAEDEKQMQPRRLHSGAVAKGVQKAVNKDLARSVSD